MLIFLSSSKVVDNHLKSTNSQLSFIPLSTSEPGAHKVNLKYNDRVSVSVSVGLCICGVKADKLERINHYIQISKLLIKT